MLSAKIIMENKKPGLHVVIYYQWDSKAQLQKKLITYTKKFSDDLCQPSMDNSYLKKVKAAQQAFTGGTISSFNVNRSQKDTEQLCIFIKILLSLILQQLSENTPDCTVIDNWMIISTYYQK
ncbi:MAG TPA: hypothetical protein DIC60_04595 [Lachnospiraceae bacterium]|nr:hypothetical protein [Lachnospiraceae bacterium]